VPIDAEKIAGEKVFNGKPMVISIQDFHCHAEVQRNICRILRQIDQQYGLSQILVEGASGPIDTSWLCELKDASLKQKIADALLSEGRLTGAEYYSVMNNKPRLLYGIENDKIHKENIIRLGKLLERTDFLQRKISEMRRRLAALESRYFSKAIKKFF
jgi:hypothetical protein